MFVGILFGLGLRLYGGSGNAFEVDPGIFVADVLLALGLLVGLVLVGIRSRRKLGANVLLSCVSAIATAYLLLTIWPYPKLLEPIPVEQLEHQRR